MIVYFERADWAQGKVWIEAPDKMAREVHAKLIIYAVNDVHILMSISTHKLTFRLK